MAGTTSKTDTPIFAQIAADHKKLKELAQARGQAIQLQMDITRLKAVTSIEQLRELISAMENELPSRPTKRKSK